MRNSRLVSVVLLVSLFAPMFITPIVPTFSSEARVVETTSASSFASLFSAPPLPQVPRTVRVAIYTESNLTRPSYATIGAMAFNGLDNLSSVLLSAGYQVTNLTTDDIANHQLLTSRFDVLIIPDNLPRERIVNQIKEFWLGGGGIFSFDSAISFVCYAGILPHESEGFENYGVYWTYSPYANQHDVQVRHPVTKAYQVNQLLNTTSMDYGAFDWTALGASSAAGEVVLLAYKAGYPNWASLVAYDSSTKGGRFVQAPLLGPVPANMEDLVVDACDWLSPRPKARVVFDLSHAPRLGVDSWDALASFPGYYYLFRDNLVNRRYTFDKLYPSASGNFTQVRLDPYDVLIICAPDADYTTSDRTAFNNWVTGGGSALILGENPLLGGFRDPDLRINFLLNSFDMEMNPSLGASAANTVSDFDLHPTIAAVAGLNWDYHGYINTTGSAYSIGRIASNIMISGQTYGQGRVILTSDINWPDFNHFTSLDNDFFAMNAINWLSAATANVLLYVDEPSSPNYYRTPVCEALNDLGIPFHLTWMAAFLNLSLHTDSWDLVIVDDPWYVLSSVYDEFIDYIEAGGHFLMSGYTVDNDWGHALWRQLGFEFDADGPDGAELFIWDSGHDIFNQPIMYGAANFTPSFDYGDEGDMLSVFANATALAGFTSSPTAGNASIVLRNDLRTLYNGYLIDEFWDDIDDSAYPDNLELWINEIAFMMRPVCTITPDVPVNVTEGEILTFHAEVTNLGFSTALMGEITVNVPGGLGTLMDPATQPFNVVPGDFTTLTWHVNVTGTGNYTLSFSTTYHGLAGTTYTGVPEQADIEALAALPPPPPPPPPGWWWIVALAVIIVIVIIIVIYMFLKRRGASK